MPDSSADRNLLAGVFALQHEFVTRDQPVEAMNRWVLQKLTHWSICCRSRRTAA